MFVELQDERWLFDTGAPSSFGDLTPLHLADHCFELASNYLGLTAETLSKLVGVNCCGLIGADIINNFDHIFDQAKSKLILSVDQLSHPGSAIKLSDFMGIPIVEVIIEGSKYQMFFDTGAQYSYFQDDSLANFPSLGTVEDFFPGVGNFQTETHELPVVIGQHTFSLQCGRLPSLLGATLMMANTQGIIGNQVFNKPQVAYFPRRNALYL